MRFARRRVERRIVGMDHHQNVVDAGMGGKGGDGARQHRQAAD